jgi:hypothetical protein
MTHDSSPQGVGSARDRGVGGGVDTWDVGSRAKELRRGSAGARSAVLGVLNLNVHSARYLYDAVCQADINNKRDCRALPASSWLLWSICLCSAFYPVHF